MKLAVSNIAWTPDEDAAACDLLRRLGISLLEIAPPRWWADPANVCEAKARQRTTELRHRGLSIAAFQAILFGRPELTLFGDTEARTACLEYLGGIARLAAACGAGPMVFGAPKNRLVPDGMPVSVADAIAAQFLEKLAVHAVELGVYFCLEPNPTVYGCNYLTHASAAATMVRRIDSPGLRLQIDAGELAMNDENVEQVIGEHADLIGHVHISEAMLGGFDSPWNGHETLAKALSKAGYRGTLSIEMKRPSDGLRGVETAVKFARSCYGIA